MHLLYGRRTQIARPQRNIPRPGLSNRESAATGYIRPAKANAAPAGRVPATRMRRIIPLINAYPAAIAPTLRKHPRRKNPQTTGQRRRMLQPAAAQRRAKPL